MEATEAPNYDSIVNRDEITEVAAAAFANPEQVPEKYVRTEKVLDGVVVGADESYDRSLTWPGSSTRSWRHRRSPSSATPAETGVSFRSSRGPPGFLQF
jgi:hypothetical protein